MARRTVRAVGQESSVPLIIFIVTTVAALIGCYLLYSQWQAERTARQGLDNNITEAIYKKLQAAPDPDLRTKLENSRESLEGTGSRTPYGNDFFAVVDHVTGRMVKLWKVTDEKVGWDLNSALSEGEGGIPAALTYEGKEYDNLKSMLGELEGELSKCKRDLAQRDSDLKTVQGKLAQLIQTVKQAEEGYKKQVAELQKTVKTKDEQIKKVEADAKGKVDAAHTEAVKAQEAVAKEKETLKAEEAKVRAKVKAHLGKVRSVLDEKHISSHVEVPPDASVEQICDAVAMLLERALTPSKTVTKVIDYDGKVIQIALDIGRAYIDVGKMDGVKKGQIYTVYRVGKAGMRIPKAEVEIVKVDNTFSTVGILKHNPRDPILPGDIIISPETLKAQQAALSAQAAPPTEKAGEAVKGGGDEKKEVKKEEQ
ncbi:MAG: hypothetical protein GXP25_25245 [Planctomycetes bacterium]|nr:hypothetical protein [Planctomycetota bacterium]